MRDRFTTLPEDGDRLFSTVVTADWSYPGDSEDIDFDAAFETVKNIILQQFAGPADVGVMSRSVQETQYKTEMEILKSSPQVIHLLTQACKKYFILD